MLSRYCIHLICSREFTIRSQTLYRSKRILRDRGAELMSVGFRRRINTEESLQRSSLLLGEQNIRHLFTGLAIWPRMIMKNRMNSSYSSNRPSANSWRGKELSKFCPPNSKDEHCLFFCLYPCCMVWVLTWPRARLRGDLAATPGSTHSVAASLYLECVLTIKHTISDKAERIHFLNLFYYYYYYYYFFLFATV